MKKNLIKLMAALLAALILAAPVMALAEGESTEPTPAPVVEVKEEATPAAEAPKAEEPAPATEAPKAEEPAPATEAPKAEEPAPATEAPKAEEPAPATEAPKAEEPAPATEAPKAEEPAPAAAEQPVVTEQPVAATVEPSQPTAEPVATNTPVPAPEKFTGRVEVKRVGGGELHFGDRVTLKAVVSKANVKYSIRWEAMINGAWKKLGTDEKYEFTVTKENAGLSYRAVVVADKKANEKESDVFKLPTVTEAPVEEEPATEELVAEQPAAEEPAAEEPATEEPVVEEPAAEELVAEEPATEEPAAEEPVAEEPATEEPAAEEPVAEEPATEEPAAEEPVVEEPATEEPVAEEPAAEEPVAEEPAAEEPVVEEPVTEEPVAEEPVTEEPVAEEPVTEEPAAEEPATEEPVEAEPVEETVEELPAEELPMDTASSEKAQEKIPEVVDTPVDAEPVTAMADADVRIAADGLSDIFATLPEGTELNVLSIEGDWVMVEIEVDGVVVQGYIHKKDVLGLPEEEPVVDEAGEVVETPKKVTIFSSRRTVMTRGENVELTSLLEGFEDCSEILYQWECDSGNGFEAVPGANSATYSFKASAMTLSWGWRLTVNYR